MPNILEKRLNFDAICHNEIPPNSVGNGAEAWAQPANWPAPLTWMLHLRTHCVALAGALSFLAIGLPLPWLFGPLFSCLIAALLGISLTNLKFISNAMRTILGLAVGATITVAFLLNLVTMWDTLLLVPVIVLSVGAVGVWYFQKIAGYDFPTAYYAAMPGGLQDMIVFGEEAGGDVRSISLVHATRVLVIVVILPVVLVATWNVDLMRPPGIAATAVPVDQIVLLVFCGLAGWQLALRLGMFGASILGPLILSAIASLAGLLTTRPPAEAIWAAQYFIALGIGVKYVGVTAKELRRDVLAGLGFCLVLAIVSGLIILAVIGFGMAPPLETVLALAPGGQAELVVLAIIVGADLGFVVAHHLFRICVVILGAPILASLFNHRAR